MFNIAARILFEEELEEHQSPRVVRRSLRDSLNPLELPQWLFQKYYRVNKVVFKYLLDILSRSCDPAKKSFAIPTITKLSACLRFFAEGGYQTGVGKDYNVGLAQPSFSKVLAEVLNVLKEQLCPEWIKVCQTAAEKKKSCAGLLLKT
ncbi:uncharacterized protein LOC129939635 [Eupeodes corollae]|uniref:uncharacterized protein LOC129939635 n=1 Tax=Eupeodes corollae TaxID=290404 RepID=UPI0024901E09|nr:uncharacterized protein LOC129939635 [Eupeodes corollae]